MNELLQRQLREHFSGTGQVPENFTQLLDVISSHYDQYEKGSGLTAHSAEIIAREIMEMNSRLILENAGLKMAIKELSTFFENTDDVLYSVDMVLYKLIMISPSCEKVYGYTVEEFLGDDNLWQKVIYPADKHLAEQPIGLLRQGKQVFNQYRIIHKNKSIWWVENKIVPTLDDSGQLIHINGITREISERKITDAELEKSFSLLEATIESTADGIMVVDFEGKMIRFNKKFVELWRIPPEILDTRDDEKAIAFVLDQLINPEESVARIRELYIQKENTSFDIINFKDGRTFERYSQPQLLNGNYVGRVWSFRDITERKNNEEALRENERRLRQIIDLVPHFIFAKDAVGKFIMVNEAVAKAYGVSAEDMAGKRDADFNEHEEEVKYFTQEDLGVINSGSVRHNIEETLTDAAGNTRVLSTTKIPYTFKASEAAGVLGVSVDISERKNIEAALIKRDGQLTIATRIAKLGYWEFDVLTGLFTFDQQFFSIFKTTVEEIGGNTMAPDQYAELFVHPDDRAIVGMEVANAIASPDPNFRREIEHRIIYATGEIGWISVHFYIVKDMEGRTVKTYGVNQDITERKKGEETLRRSEVNLEIKNRELEQKNIEVEQFAYIVSHDLQEPLRTTSSFVKLLQKHYQDKPDQKADKYFTYILEASERMKLLIKSLLGFSKIGANKELEKVDCNKILHDVLADLDTVINESGAKIKYDILPVINGYATELKQLFQNLITNAIKFRKKDVPPEINISVHEIAGSWEFAFRDNGIGIDEINNEKIFSIFQRLHTQSEYEGSGIGLAHSRKIVELHKGRIWVESRRGEGSTFKFTIGRAGF